MDPHTPDWRLTTALLCCYGLFKEIRPSEPFLTEYLISNHTGVTEDQVYHDVYPVWTYAYLAILVLVFLLTDLAKYKPVIVLEGFAYIATWVLLLWGRGVGQMQLMETVYGLATSTEVAYFTYIYASVAADCYQQVTSLTRAALLLGRCVSGALGQTLVSLKVCDYRQLNYISLGMVTAATAVSFLLPPVTSTIYFHNTDPVEDRRTPEEREDSVSGDGGDGTQLLLREKGRRAVHLLHRDFRAAYSQPYVLKWSLWWALGMCGNFQVGNYIQPLWEAIRPSEATEDTQVYNGAVEAATSLAGALLALAPGFVKLDWSTLGELTLALTSLLDAVMLYLMATTATIVMGYTGYLVFRATFQMMITVASFEIARHISPSSYGLVFGLNTFLALSFQTVLTTIVADSAGLALEPRQQFRVYAGFFLVTGCGYLVLGLAGLVRAGARRGAWHRDQQDTAQ